jgi:O-antigen/teichoic acid export membrane protein
MRVRFRTGSDRGRPARPVVLPRTSVTTTPDSTAPVHHLSPTPQGAARTVIAQVGARAFALLASVGSMAIVVRYLGIEEYAGWGTVLQLIGLMAFAVDPGLSSVVVRRIVQDPASAPSPQALLPVRIGFGIVAAALIVALTIGLRGSGAALLAVALGGQILPRAIVLNATPWLQVDQRLHRQTGWEALGAVVGLALIAACAAAGASAPVLALVGFTGPTIALSVIMRFELRKVPSLTRQVPGTQWPRVRSLLVEVAPLAGALILVALYMRSYVFFINQTETDAVIGRYVFAFQFVDQLMVAAAIVGGAALPLLAVRARTATLLHDDLTHRLVVAVAAIGALAGCAMVALARILTDVIGGPEARGAEYFIQLLAPLAPLLMLSFVLAFVYVTTGRGKRYLAFNAIGLVVNLAAHVVFTLEYGADAAVRITWITELVVTGVAILPLFGVTSGRRAASTVVAMVAVVVVAGELAARTDASTLLTGLVAGAIVVLIARSSLIWLIREAVLPARPATPDVVES